MKIDGKKFWWVNVVEKWKRSARSRSPSPSFDSRMTPSSARSSSSANFSPSKPESTASSPSSQPGSLSSTPRSQSESSTTPTQRARLQPDSAWSKVFGDGPGSPLSLVGPGEPGDQKLIARRVVKQICTEMGLSYSGKFFANHFHPGTEGSVDFRKHFDAATPRRRASLKKFLKSSPVLDLNGKPASVSKIWMGIFRNPNYTGDPSVFGKVATTEAKEGKTPKDDTTGASSAPYPTFVINAVSADGTPMTIIHMAVPGWGEHVDLDCIPVRNTLHCFSCWTVVPCR